MTKPPSNHSIEFFDTQFIRQIAADDLALNPFETVVLPFVTGEVLDLGCGLGNLSIAAARQGCRVLAIDGSAHAIAALDRRALEGALDVRAELHDLAAFRLTQSFDSIVCIGLLMFFPCELAFSWLADIRDHTRPGGIAVVNVLLEGTTFLDMFNENGYTLFSEAQVNGAFPGWHIELSAVQEFVAPHDTVKRFITVVARKPGTTPRTAMLELVERNQTE
jgi:tellurite methyltransferase